VETIKFEDLTLADDFIFRQVFSRREIAKEFIEHLFGQKVVSISEPVVQAVDEFTMDSHGVRFDVKFSDESTVYNIEMQQYSDKSSISVKELENLVRRVRYYQGLLDANSLERGQDYIELKDSRVVFICTADPFGMGLARYDLVSRIEQRPNYPYNDGRHAVYLNTHYTLDNTDSEEIKEFLTYLSRPTSHIFAGEFVQRLNSAVEENKRNAASKEAYLRMTMDRRMYMAQAREEGREEGHAEGHEEGLAEGREEGLDLAIQRLVLATRMSEEEATAIIRGTVAQNPVDKLREQIKSHGVSRLDLDSGRRQV